MSENHGKFEETWREFHSEFDTDDGSLPEIEIDHLSAPEVSAIYRHLRIRSRPAGTNDPPMLWLEDEKREASIDAFPDPAALVQSGRAAGFHHCVDMIPRDGAAIPTLGVFVLSNYISIDYRMGPEWNPGALAALVELLRECAALAPGARIRVRRWTPEDADRFERAVRKGIGP